MVKEKRWIEPVKRRMRPSISTRTRPGIPDESFEWPRVEDAPDHEHKEFSREDFEKALRKVSRRLTISEAGQG